MAATPAAAPAASSAIPRTPLPSSLSELRALASDVADFFARFDDLQSHLDGINVAIDRRFQGLESPGSDDPAAGDAAAGAGSGLGGIRSELEVICEGMDGRRMRKYISTLLDSKDGKDAAALRAEVGAALRKAKDVAKFAMSCVGRFYLQGSKAYERPGPMAAVRRSCVLVLEAFLIAGGSAKVDDRTRAAAATEALAWKKRILQEGGMGVCSDMDARGLLLFMASFGIPPNFGKDDLIKLMNGSEIWKDLDVLRASTVLRNEAEDLVQRMVKKGKLDAALELVKAFGVEEKFSPVSLVTSFLNEVFENAKQTKRERQGSHDSVKAGTGKQLAALKMAALCIKKFQIDPDKFSHFKINEKMEELEKIILSSKKIIDSKQKGVQRLASPIMNNAKRQRLTPSSQMAHAGPSLLPYMEQGVKVHGLHRIEEYEPPLLGLRERYRTGLASPNKSHLVGRAVTGLMMGGPPATMVEDIDGRVYPVTRSDGRDPFATEVGSDVYLRGDTGVGPIVSNRAAGISGRGLGDPGLLFSEETTRRGILQHYYNGYMEASQGHGGVQSNGGATGGSSYSYGYRDAYVEHEASRRVNEPLVTANSVYGLHPPYH